jgi:hypothetical protein
MRPGLEGRLAAQLFGRAAELVGVLEDGHRPLGLARHPPADLVAAVAEGSISHLFGGALHHHILPVPIPDINLVLTTVC